MSEPGDWSCSPFMADALHANNLTAFRRADGHYLHADRWLQDHVVHAMDACPDVIEYWVINAPPMGRAQRLYRYTAQALDHLSEEDKTELLEGKSTIAARRNLYKYLKDPVQGEHWMSLSPLWVGKSGSALREAAMALRWNPNDMPRMLVEGMHWDLGMQDAFADALRDGQLLGWGIEADAPLALPSAFEMGDDPMELPELDVGGSP